jgi:hypothetical protein
MAWRPKFSLLTFVLLALGAGCAMLFLRDFAPWRVARTFAVLPAANHDFTPDSHWFLNGDDPCELWDLQSGRVVTTFDVDPKRIRAVALSIDGRRAAVLTQKPNGAENRLRVFDAQSGALLGEARDQSDPLVFSADGTALLACYTLLNVAHEMEPLVLGHPYTRPCDEAENAAFQLKLKRQAERASAALTLRDYASAAPDLWINVTVSPSRRVLVTESNETGRAQVWNWPSQTKLGEIPHLPYHGAFLFFPDEKRVVVSDGAEGNSMTTRIVDVQTGATTATLLGISDPTMTTDTISGDGKRIVSTEYGENHAPISFVVRELAASREPIVVPCPYAVTEPVISHDGMRLAYGYEDMGENTNTFAVRIANADTSHTVTPLHYPEALGQQIVRFGHDGETLYTDTYGALLLWRRYRPEPAWGVVCLWEFWMLAASVVALGWSVWRDRARFAVAVQSSRQD